MAEPTTSATTSEPGGGHEVEATAFGFDAYGWIAISMLLVFAIMLVQKVPAAIGRALDKKIDAIREQLSEAEELRKEAEALKSEYAAKAAAAESEAAAMVERARNESKALIEKAREDANSMIERRSRLAEEKIAAEEREAVQKLRAAASQAAAQAAARLIAEHMDPKTDAALVDSAIGDLGKGR